MSFKQAALEYQTTLDSFCSERLQLLLPQGEIILARLMQSCDFAILMMI